MSSGLDILCIGSVLWDVIGRHQRAMELGYDVPGQITRLPGGVAMNVAMTLIRFGLRPGVLSAIGHDREGQELIRACEALGVEAGFAHRDASLPTDRYMAIEGANGLIAAIADAGSLERAGAAILAPLRDGRLASDSAPWAGPIVLDGNLSPELLAQIAHGHLAPVLAAADLRVVPASPGKASRLRPLLSRPNVTLYINRTEAELILNRSFADSGAAAGAFVQEGAARVLITDGAQACSDACANEMHRALPPQIHAKRITGAGDTFMAAHIAAELVGHGRAYALEAAVQAAASYVSGDDADQE
ncbi:MAG: PfkB family carbohydrate kinase [Mangrovicoccus sp.]|nr:PfkB family carbohydrate kinase [Mangrovicoccus sp.]